MIKQFYATSFKHGSISNVTILTIWIINIYKVVGSHIASLLVPMPFPFGNLNNQNFLNVIGNNNTITSSEKNNLKSFLLLKPPPGLALFFNQFNKSISENRSDPENVISISYMS